jgi:hypothetical protein
MTSPVTIRRNDFVREIKSTTIDVETAKADTRLEGVDVGAADLDRDGKITGKREAGALFDEIDKVDRDANAKTITTVDKSGAETDSARRVAAVGDLARAGSLQRAGRAAEAGNDDVLFVGVRHEVKDEYKAFAKRAKGEGYGTQWIGGDKSTIDVGGKTYDLSTDTGVRDFADALGLPKKQADAVYEALKSNPKSGRDELAAIAVALAEGEKGGKVPSRMIVSGHHAMGQFTGDYGTISDSSLQALARALPKGAAQVEDLHLAGCYSSGRARIDTWREAFPGMRTLWAYDDSAPGFDSGAVKHQQLWDEATRGRVGILDRGIAKGTRLGEEVLVWSEQGGFDDGSALKDLSTLKASISYYESSYDKAFTGEQKIDDPHQGFVRDYYTALNDLIDHPDLKADERAQAQDRAARTIRLLYFKEVSKNWSSSNDAVLTDAYAAAGLKKPDFAKLDRKQSLSAIDDFMNKTAGSKDPKIIEAREQMKHLKELDPDHIPIAWIN